MISEEVRALIVSQLQAGRKVPELVPMFSEFCKRTTLYQVAKEWKAGIVEKPKKNKK